MHRTNYLKNKLTTLSLLAIVSSLLALTAYAAWEVQPKLGHSLTPLPKPVPAPDFTLEDMDEEKHSFKDLRGKVVLLNFWATWCPPCRREMPSMERLYQKLNGENFTVIAVNQMEDGDHVFAYTGQLEVDPTFTILFDKDSKVSNSFRVNGLPTTFLIDKQGNIRYRAIGGREFDHPEVEKTDQAIDAGIGYNWFIIRTLKSSKRISDTTSVILGFDNKNSTSSAHI